MADPTENQEFVEVNENSFYKAMGPLNVHPHIRGSWDEPSYRSNFLTPQGELMGYNIPNCRHDGMPDKYFIARALA